MRCRWLYGLGLALLVACAPEAPVDDVAPEAAVVPSSAPEVPGTTSIVDRPPTTTAPTDAIAGPSSTVAAPACPGTPVASSVPAAVAASLEAAARHPAFDNVDLSISVWIDGWGEVLAVNPDLPLAPASNQKLLVAIGANALLDPSHRFSTAFELQDGDLVLRAGGDPSLTHAHVDAMAAEVADAGVAAVERLIIDISAHPQPPRATGWLDWQIPTYVGPLSGLMLDDNRWTRTEKFVADPALVNGERVADRLRAAGLAVGTVELGARPTGEVLAEHQSAPVSELVRSMLLTSDNQHADLLLMELGRVASGQGTLSDGAAAVDAVLDEMCVPSDGVSDDGSGLSRGNQRSARELQQILRTVDGEQRERLLADLPIGGMSGTLDSRFTDDPGRVVAKTGTIIGGRALSGYATTDGGRTAVFSIIVNGEPDAAAGTLGAIDELVTTILRLE